MKVLCRLLLLAFCAGLLFSVYGMHSGLTQSSLGHDTYDTIKWPGLFEVRQVSLFGVLIWCFLFARRETALVRLGLVALILAFAIMALPPKILKHPITLPHWH